MMPLPARWLSCLLVRVRGEMLLFDCGEGTQVALAALGWGFGRLGVIAISHCHADHVSGLPGLLLRLANAERTAPLTLLGPAGLCEVYRALRCIVPHLPFEVRCVELAPGDARAVAGGRLLTAQGEHEVPCLAYRFEIERQRAFLPDRARELSLPVSLWHQLQQGQAVLWGDRIVQPDEVLGPPRRGLAVAYVTDTRPTPQIARLVNGADLLVCEGTYGRDEDREKAVERGHMTFREAATLAATAGVRRLWLTHFSPSLDDPAQYLATARAVFPRTEVGRDGMSTTLRFDAEDEGQPARSDRCSS